MAGDMLPAASNRAVAIVAALVIGVGGLSYAVYEHHSAESLAAQNQRVTARLNATQGQLAATNGELNVLAARVNQLQAAEEKPSPDTYGAGVVARRQLAARQRAVLPRARVNRYDTRFKKMQSQLDAQGQEINETRGDLASARTELSGGIAKNHDQLVALQRKGEESYFEFDIVKNKEYKRAGPLNVRLRKANVKHQYADLMLVVDDRDVTQKHVNLYQPVMFYTPDSPKPVEVVINSITKNHIHGYVSAPKYKTSELNAMANGQSQVSTRVATNQNGDPTLRQRTPAVVNVPPGVPEE